MKVSEAIQEVDSLKVNMYPQAQKIKWLSRLDLRIKKEILDTHEYNEGEEEPSFDGYDSSDLETDLLVGEPYAEMYVHWLEAQIDYNNMEYDGFNASNAMFESTYAAFRNAYNATHMPNGQKRRYY